MYIQRINFFIINNRCYRLFGVKTLFPIPGKSAMDEL